MEPGLLDSPERFEEYAQDALDSLPTDLRAQMSNVEIVVEEEPPPGQRLLGLYQGVPLTRRGSFYGGVLPDKITIYCGPLVRLYAHDPERLRRESSRL
ncbi:MAG: metallopeptidase family protein [Gaiellaceae bacterium]